MESKCNIFSVTYKSVHSILLPKQNITDSVQSKLFVIIKYIIQGMSGMSGGQAVADNVVRRFVRFPTTVKASTYLEKDMSLIVC